TIKESEKRISAPGISDNSRGVAGLFGLIWAIKKEKPLLHGDIWLVANVGEEGLGDLYGMREVVRRFGDAPTAYIILEGMGLGRVFNRGLGVKRHKISAHTPGGHSWANYGSPSAIHELAKLVNQIIDIKLPDSPRTSMNVGVIEGGTSINTIANQASIQLDLRSVSQDELLKLEDKVKKLVAKSNKKNILFEIEVIGNRPSGEIADSHPLVNISLEEHKQAGIQANLNIGSTDANIPLSLGLPAICMGLTTGGNPHRLDEFMHKAPLAKGLDILYKIVTRLLA
ncbi:MAG: M20/M25/M40 family metallo-hydrolase, partial [Chloroflexota bacterium]